LAGAARPHDRHQILALDRQVDVVERAYLAGSGAVDLRYLAQLECACHEETSIARVASGGRSTSVGGGHGSCWSRTSAASSQRTIASSRKSSASMTSASAT